MRKQLSLLILSIISLIGSCSTTTDYSRNNVSPENNESESTLQNRKQSGNIDSFSLNTYPRKNTFLIAAVAPRLQYDYLEEGYALLNACRQLSIYYGAYISYQKLIDENIIGTVQKQQVNILYDENLALSFLNKLKVLETDRGLDYFSTLINMEGITLPDYPQIDLSPEEKPTWINSPPDFEGFITGVGVSARRKNTSDSWLMADKLAIAEVANRINTSINAGTATIEQDKASTSVIKSLSISKVHIKGLYILSRWRDPDNSYYYSLVITEKL